MTVNDEHSPYELREFETAFLRGEKTQGLNEKKKQEEKSGKYTIDPRRKSRVRNGAHRSLRRKGDLKNFKKKAAPLISSVRTTEGGMITTTLPYCSHQDRLKREKVD